MITQGILQLLTSDTDVSALVGTKVQWILAPKGWTLPYIILGRVDVGDTYTTEGTSGLRDLLLQVDCYATDYYTSQSIALAVRQLLESYRGNLPDVNSTAVTAVFTEKDWDMPYEEGAKGFVYRALLEFRIWYYESAVAISPAPDMTLTIDGGDF